MVVELMYNKKELGFIVKRYNRIMDFTNLINSLAYGEEEFKKTLWLKMSEEIETLLYIMYKYCRRDESFKEKMHNLWYDYACKNLKLKQKEDFDIYKDNDFIIEGRAIAEHYLIG